jgi:hypothetical protein
MARNLKLHRLSFVEERAILTFVTASKSLDEIAARLNRRPDLIVRKARTLGISFDAAGMPSQRSGPLTDEIRPASAALPDRG